jgi:hypothetical protein
MRIILADDPVKSGWARQATLVAQPELNLIIIQFFQKTHSIKFQDAGKVIMPVGK